MACFQLIHWIYNCLWDNNSSWRTVTCTSKKKKRKRLVWCTSEKLARHRQQWAQLPSVQLHMLHVNSYRVAAPRALGRWRNLCANGCSKQRITCVHRKNNQNTLVKKIKYQTDLCVFRRDYYYCSGHRSLRWLLPPMRPFLTELQGPGGTAARSPHLRPLPWKQF